MMNEEMIRRKNDEGEKMIKEKYIATFVGCALGDTLGMPVEGLKREQIKKYVGRIDSMIDPVIIRDSSGAKVTQDEFGVLKYWNEDLKKGEYTDDTILPVALAESIIARQGLDLDDVGRRQLEAYIRMRRPDGTVKGGFGGTTRDAFKNLESGVSPRDSGVIGGPGNAPVTKMFPIGIYMHATGKYDEGLRFAELVGRITHRDPRSVASGVVQAHAVYTALQGGTREEFVKSIAQIRVSVEKSLIPELKWCPSTMIGPLTSALMKVGLWPNYTLWKQGSLKSRLEWIVKNKDADCEDAFKYLGSSSAVYESFPFAIFMFQKFWEDPVSGLLETVNYGGDCDSTGAMYGALAGARNGMIFPSKWLNKLDGLDRLVSVGEQMYALARGACS